MFSFIPFNLNYSFNFGIILVISTIFLILSGVFSVVFYNNNLDISFLNLILHSFNSFNYFFLRVFHNTFANLFFLFIFLHIFLFIFLHIIRSWLFSSYNVLLTLLFSVLIFFGYCLSMGQIFYWAVVVIFSLLFIIPFCIFFVSSMFLFFLLLHYLCLIFFIALLFLFFNFYLIGLLFHLILSFLFLKFKCLNIDFYFIFWRLMTVLPSFLIVLLNLSFFFGLTAFANGGDVSPAIQLVYNNPSGLSDYLAFLYYSDHLHPIVSHYGPHYVNYELVSNSLNNVRIMHYNNLMCNNCTFYNGIRYSLSPLV